VQTEHRAQSLRLSDLKRTVRIFLVDAFPDKKVYADPLQQDVLALVKTNYPDLEWAQPFIDGSKSVNKLATAVAAEFKLGIHRTNLRTSLWRSVRVFEFV
jgi:hypothetical protein